MAQYIACDPHNESDVHEAQWSVVVSYMGAHHQTDMCDEALREWLSNTAVIAEFPFDWTQINRVQDHRPKT